MLIFNSFNMDITTLFVAGIVFIMTCYLMSVKEKNKYKLPPGPLRLPIIGTSYCHVFTMESLLQLKAKFGDVVQLHAGPIRVVALNSYETIKEATVNKYDACSNRGAHKSFTMKINNPNLKGILMSDFHSRLRQNRSDSLTILKNLGVGRTTMEEIILEEMGALADTFSDFKGNEFDPWHIITCAVTNVILSVTLNKRHDHNDPEFIRVMKCADDFVGEGAYSQLIDGLPWLRHLPSFKSSLQRLIAGDRGMIQYMKKYSTQVMDDYHPGDNSDFVESWLDKKFNEVIQEADFDEEDFLFILRDLLVAGSETTATSLKWTILHMANNQVLQEQMHEEIDRVIGKHRSIRLSDRDDLPLIEGLMWEIQRYNSIVPTALSHYTNTDTSIGGYDVPADTFLILNLHNVHMNPDVFFQPEVFRPQRFINEEGKCVRHPHVIPFGMGKRACLGELLAKQELFLFTSLLQKFTFKPPNGVNKINEIGDMNFTNAPKRFRIRAITR